MTCSNTATANRRLTVRLDGSEADLVAVQRLRAKVFMEEMGAQGSAGYFDQIDADIYDPLCDHLLVVDEDAGNGGEVVGTYRLLRESVANASFGFYSASEFDLDPIIAGSGRPKGELLELGRSCVLPEYRTSGTISLLWRGIADYIAVHRIALLFGCASFPGTDPDSHAQALSYLAHRHLAAPEQRPSVLAGKGDRLERLPQGSYDERRAMLQLPPLVKGYLRAGASFGDGIYIDHDFNTVDVCVVMPVIQISNRYAQRFSVAA